MYLAGLVFFEKNFKTAQGLINNDFPDVEQFDVIGQKLGKIRSWAQ